MKTLLISIILIFIALSIQATGKDDKKKEPANATSGPIEGIVYALPQTGIRIHVKATRDHFVHGPFQAYAQKMLGIDNVPSADADRWNLDEMQLETFYEPDPDQVHKAMGPSAQLISLTESGILTGINSKEKNHEPDIQTHSFLKKDLENQVKFTDLSILSFYTPADSGKKIKMIAKNLDQKAAEAAETIFNLRNSRFGLLTNANAEPLPDGKSFEVMTVELGKMEENYLSLFLGKSSRQTYKFSFDYLPGQKSVKGEVIFRFSDDRGVLPKSDLSGRPIVIEVNKSENLASKQNGLSGSENPGAGGSGIYYRMPGMAEIRILDGSAQLAVARVGVAQFGTVAPVPETLLDGNHKLEFYPNTGAVKSILEINIPRENQK